MKWKITMVAGLSCISLWMCFITSPAGSHPNKTEFCSNCHGLDASTSISIGVSQTDTHITYSVSGSNNYNSPEGWGVFDTANIKIAYGYGAGSFEVPRDGQMYRLYWVDDADNDPSAPDPGKGGSAFVDVVADARNIADFNDDGEVNFIDFSGLSSAWKSSLGDPNFYNIYDLHIDDTIDMLDLRIFVENWLW